MSVIIQNALSRESILGRADLCPDRDSSEECDCRGRRETGRCIALGTQAGRGTEDQSHYHRTRVSESGARRHHYHHSGWRHIRRRKCPALSEIREIAPSAAIRQADRRRGCPTPPYGRGHSENRARGIGQIGRTRRRPQMNQLAIDTKDLAKTYAGIRAVSGINLTVPRGSIYGFLGRNGAGKTTTIKMLLGLTRPTAGAAHVLGMDVAAER